LARVPRLLGSDWNHLANSESDWRGIFGSIAGIVKDESGSAIGNASASAEVMNPLSGFHRETTTDSDGAFRFTDVPFNRYHVVVSSFTGSLESIGWGRCGACVKRTRARLKPTGTDRQFVATVGIDTTQ
jgi:hypothetical protein